ncbi:MAG TPA: cache and HAMP domain-containing protein, partial [Symbiobacteriaceae bacterium]|nr:cache and HAMP domain-containing protein [Symbiobacteriaceae bacterium]
MRTFISRLLAPLNNLRLRYKILLLCVSLVVFATSLTGFYSYNAAARLVTDQAYSQSRATVTQAANFLDEKLRNVLWLGFFLQTDPAVAAALADGGATEYGAHFSAVQSSFSSVRMREKTVDSALISTPSGDYFETIHITAAPFRETEMYQAARRQEQFIWFPAHPDPLFRGEEPVLTLVLPVSVPEPAEDSFVVVNLSADWFAEYLSKVSQGALLMVDAAGTPVVPASLSPGAAEAIRELRGPYGEVDGDEPLILHQAPIPSTDWRVVLVQPKAALLAGASAIQVAALMVMAVTLAISLFLSFWMAHSIARPLDVLGVLMHQIEARNFGTTFKARYSDEIGDLGRSFNRMSRRLD